MDEADISRIERAGGAVARDVGDAVNGAQAIMDKRINRTIFVGQFGQVAISLQLEMGDEDPAAVAFQEVGIILSFAVVLFDFAMFIMGRQDRGRAIDSGEFYGLSATCDEIGGAESERSRERMNAAADEEARFARQSDDLIGS